MSFLRRRSPDAGRDCLRLYYASDVHGSERCWRKFLNATHAYRVSALIMGGDLTGKAIVPIAREGERYRARFLNEERLAITQIELEELCDAIRFNGMYPWIALPEEITAYAQQRADTKGLFEKLIRAEVERWTGLADQRASAAADGVFVMAGNDDPWFVDELLDAAQRIVFCDGRVVEVGDHEMISSSYANPTPWDSPRELDEDALYNALAPLAQQLTDPSTAIFNLHVPPYNSGLDTAPRLNDDLSIVTAAGEPVTVPVGSKAVRELIEEFQPLLALHGHIHESRGFGTIGRTTVINPGSEYNNGTIHGAVISLGSTRVVSRQLVAG